MAFYGRSPEEAVLRGEEHPYSARSITPKLPELTRTRSVVETAGQKRPEAALHARSESDAQKRNFVIPGITRGLEFWPGFEAKLDVGRRQMIKFTKRF